MPVKLNPPGGPEPILLTSPHEAVITNLGECWIAKEVWHGDRQIVVTVPFPDTIRLTGEILNEDLVVPDQSGKSVVALYQDLDDEFLHFLAKFPASPAAGIKAEKLTKYEVNVSLSDGDGTLAWAALKRRKGKDFGVWSFTVQFSPFKVGSARLSTMIEKLEDAFCMINFVQLISRLQVSRCDLAIDIYGLRPFDLVLSPNGSGKSCVWSNQMHHELVYLYAPKPYPNTKPKHGSYKAHGRMLARIYDRSARAKWFKLPQPAHGLPVTRFEVSRAWRSSRPTLAELSEVKNMLSGLGAGYAWPSKLATDETWERIHRARFPCGTKWCEMHPSIYRGIKLNRLYDDYPADLVSPDAWSRWGDGLALTGIEKLT